MPVGMRGVLNDMDVILKRYTDVLERPQSNQLAYLSTD